MILLKGKRKVIFFTSLLSLAGCSSDLTPEKDQPVPMGREESRKKDFGNLFGDDFLLFGGPKKEVSPGAPSSSVNSFIWRASLDVLSFMPLSSADAIGGVIVTEWYTAPHAPQQRIKVTVYVLNPQLRSDAVKVTFYKQVSKGGSWVNTPADANSATEVENLILSKARQLRLKYLQENK